MPLSDMIWSEICNDVSKVRVKSGDHLLRVGEQATRIFFLSSGLLREYYIDKAGRESTRRFCAENEFSGSLTDLISGGKSMTSIQAIDDGEVWVIPWRKIDALSEREPQVMKLLRRFAETLYVRKTKREFEMLTLPAAERYQRFLLEHPSLDKRLSRNMVASYLGITPVHLSRICSAEKLSQSPAVPGKRT